MEATSSGLADAVRRLRAERGLTAAELCLRSGVAKATLSAIEAGRGNPRLETLRDLAEALAVDVIDLLGAPAPPAVTVVRRTEGTELPDLAVPGRLVRSVTMGAALVEFYELEIRPGGHETSASHGVGAHEHVFCLSGRVRLGPIDAPVDLEEGDYVSYPADRPHSWVAIDDEPARVWVTQVMPLAQAARGDHT